MTTFTSSPGTLRLFILSIAARLPLAMLAIGVLVHVEAQTGSFAIAGLAGGALAIAQGFGGPLLGRMADRQGQTAVLAGSALICGSALATLASVPADEALALTLGLSALVGATTPPVPACMRTLLPAVIDDERRLRGAYAIDSAAVELTWISGPPLVLGVGALLSTGMALTLSAALMTVFTLLFASTTTSRSWRPAPVVGGSTRGALRSGTVRLLALVMAGAGLLFGATEVAVTAAAEAQGSAAGAGPLLGLWGLGGFLGGLAIARSGGGARTVGGLIGLLAALGVAHLALAAVATTPVALAIGIVLAGSLIAPTCASAYAMVDGAALTGTTTEAFAWLATAVAIGTSAGAAAAGALAEAAGPTAAFVLAGATACLVAAATAAAAATPRAARPVTAPAATAA